MVRGVVEFSERQPHHRSPAETRNHRALWGQILRLASHEDYRIGEKLGRLRVPSCEFCQPIFWISADRVHLLDIL